MPNWANRAAPHRPPPLFSGASPGGCPLCRLCHQYFPQAADDDFGFRFGEVQRVNHQFVGRAELLQVDGRVALLEAGGDPGPR